MTANKRIALNTIASYGRSLYAALCGIFSARWVLQALGAQDYGLYAVVGSMAIFMGYLNIQFSGASSRFYAYAVGCAKTSADNESGLRECQSWFTTALVIHTVLPVVLVAVGLPLGSFALEHGWIAVPLDRVDTCRWLWRFVCISTFCSMLSAPFQAMYIAKQYIAELTIYNFVQTTLKTALVFCMTTKQRDWLMIYGAAMAAIIVLPQMLICVRAVFVFRECRIIPKALLEFKRVMQLANYALWTAIGGLGYLASHQCFGIVINNNFGPGVVAGFGISQTVATEASTLTGALQTAFQPAITTAYGAGELVRMRRMALLVCKVGTLLTLIFAIPMMIEINEILRLWLKTPPPYAGAMCVSTLTFIAIEKLSCGHLMAVCASGRVARFQVLRGVLRSLVLPMALVAIYFGMGPDIVAVALPASIVFVVAGDAYLARRSVGLDLWRWFHSVVMPVAVCGALVVSVGILPHLLMPPSLFRVAVTTVLTTAGMLLAAFAIVLTAEERQNICEMFKRKFIKNRG